MKYLIDTLVLIWFELNSKELPNSILDILTNPENEIIVPQISLFEIAVKQHIDKLPELKWTTKQITEQLIIDNFELLTIENEHIERYIKLPIIQNHRDPFDRLIIATVIYEKLTIISMDYKFRFYLDLVNVIHE